MNIIFIRHGDPDYALDSLTEKGFREANLLKDRIDRLEVKEFYSSSLGRAKTTAKVAMEHTGREPIILEWMKEFYVPIKNPETGKDHVPWDFMPTYWTEKEEMYDKDQWMKSEIFQQVPIEAEYRRITACFDQLLETYGYYRHKNYYLATPGCDDTIVIFCHLGSQFVMLSHLLGISPVVLWQGLFVAPSSVTVVASEERHVGEAAFRCKTIGDTSHLYAGSEPVSNSGLFPRNPIQV